MWKNQWNFKRSVDESFQSSRTEESVIANHKIRDNLRRRVKDNVHAILSSDDLQDVE